MADPLSEQNDIDEAARVIAGGGLVAMPTETVYGLAADATNDAAVARIFEAKGRPRFNPLIAHVTGIEMARAHGDFSPLAMRLAEAFWPGPLTLVLPRREESALSLLVSAGLDTVAIRAPAHPIASALIEAAGRPLAAPSANPSGAVSPTTADHVREGLGDKVDRILDGGPCEVGVESTIIRVDAGAAAILRAGGLARERLEAVIGEPLLDPQAEHGPAAANRPRAPGMLASHYAPRAALRLNVERPEPDEAFLAFGAAPERAAHVLNLSPAGDLREAAANLFAHLRALDKICAKQNLAGIAAAPVPQVGLGEAINDRLKRAAAPRP